MSIRGGLLRNGVSLWFSIRQELAVFLLFVVVAGVLQVASGAIGGAFGAQADESAHYVTSLMIREYLAHGVPENPRVFAENFYIHYPRVAFGLWPPLFHILLGVWMLAFGSSWPAVLALFAIIAGTGGYLLFRAARSMVGRGLAFASALLLVSLPAFQKSYTVVMLDLPLAVLMLASVLEFAKYLDSGERRHSVWFGVLASAAILTKYNGLALALVPPLSVLLTARFDLLKKRVFWLPAALVLVIAGSWYALAYKLVLYAAEPGQEWPGLAATAMGNAEEIVRLTGPLLFVVAVAGAVMALYGSYSKWSRCSGKALPVVLVSLTLAVWLFHSVLYPIRETRYVLPAAPCLILLAVLAVSEFARLHMRSRQWRFAAGSVLLALYAVTLFSVPQKKSNAFVKAAGIVLSQGLSSDSVILVSSDAGGEGMFVSEIAMRQEHPDLIVARASKIFAERTLMRQDYKLLYQTPGELMATMDSIPVTLAVVDKCSAERCGEHAVLLARAMMEMPERWELLDRVTSEGANPLEIYRLRGNEGKPLRRIQVDMKYSLGKTLEMTIAPPEASRSRTPD